MLPTVRAMQRLLDGLLGAADGDEPRGIVRPRQAAVSRFGLALDPHPALCEWVAAERLDALFLHRPWRLAEEQIPAHLGVIAYHSPFDRHLTCGFNPRLADALEMRALRPFGRGDGRVIGMCGEVAPQSVPAFARTVEREFGGVDAVIQPARGAVERVAVVGAMTDALVREAAAEGVDLYLTGQLRVPARAAVSATGIGVVAVGHHRSEQWGLGALAAILRGAWPALETIVRPLG
jgi:putative NIF3 family GTP cyclohydrolase 1 type 2